MCRPGRCRRTVGLRRGAREYLHLAAYMPWVPWRGDGVPVSRCRAVTRCDGGPAEPEPTRTDLLRFGRRALTRGTNRGPAQPRSPKQPIELGQSHFAAALTRTDDPMSAGAPRAAGQRGQLAQPADSILSRAPESWHDPLRSLRYLDRGGRGLAGGGTSERLQVEEHGAEALSDTTLAVA